MNTFRCESSSDNSERQQVFPFIHISSRFVVVVVVAIAVAFDFGFINKAQILVSHS